MADFGLVKQSLALKAHDMHGSAFDRSGTAVLWCSLGQQGRDVARSGGCLAEVMGSWERWVETEN